MIILEKYRLLEKSLGLDPLGGPRNVLLRTVILTVFFSFNSMELVFIISNIRGDIEETASALAPICGVGPAMATYALLLIFRERYYSLMNGMQDIVGESM